MNYEMLSRYRAALMGLAMLFVMFFHVPMAKGELMYGLVRLGNIGVDMFLFLSGIGLWFSWTKSVSRIEDSYRGCEGTGVRGYENGNEAPNGNPAPSHLRTSAPTDGNLAPSRPRTSAPSRICSFYRKRLLRIYPAWIIIACLYYIPDFFGTDLFGQFDYATGADWHSTKSPNVLHLIGNILVNWSFWRIDDGAFWFIPSIMAMYVFAPFYMELIRRHPVYRWMPVVAMVWAVMVQYMPPIHEAVGHIEIFWSRIPIFLIGINCGELVKQKKPIEPSVLWLLLITFGLSLWMCIEFENHWRGHFPLFLERMVYIPLCISCMLLVCKFFSGYEVRGTRYENSFSGCEVRGARCENGFSRYEVRGARCENQRSAPTGKANSDKGQASELEGNLVPRTPHLVPRIIIRSLTFIGGISLEIYLVHAQFVLRYLTPMKLGYCLTVVLLIAISLPLAWLLKRLTNLIMDN